MADRSIITRSPSEMEPRRVEEEPFFGIQRRMNRLFDEFFNEPFGLAPMREFGQNFMPRVDVYEDEKEMRVTAELPGMDEKDIDITLDREVLTIRGEKSSETKEENGQYHRIERSYGSFERQIPLSMEVDANKVDAEFKKGVLTITLPKPVEATSRVKKIAVKKA